MNENNIEELNIAIHDYSFLEPLPNLREAISPTVDSVMVRKVFTGDGFFFEMHVDRELLKLEHSMTDAITVIDTMTKDMHGTQILVSGKVTDGSRPETFVRAAGWVKLNSEQERELFIILAVNDTVERFMVDNNINSHNEAIADDKLRRVIKELLGCT